MLALSPYGTKRTIAALQQFGRYWTNNGQREAPGLNGSAANDPQATLAVHCGNDFDAGFSPYQGTRLSR
jgi:hypothetical protein